MKTHRRRELEDFAKKLGYRLDTFEDSSRTDSPRIGWVFRDPETGSMIPETGTIIYYRTLDDVEAELRKQEREFKERQQKRDRQEKEESFKEVYDFAVRNLELAKRLGDEDAEADAEYTLLKIKERMYS